MLSCCVVGPLSWLGARRLTYSRVKGDGDDERQADPHAEKQADLHHPTLRPRAHVLGCPDAQWAGVAVGTSGFRRGEGVDVDGGGGREGGGVDVDEVDILLVSL